MTPKVITNSRVPKLLSWFINIKAITIGPYIFVDGEPTERLLRHEMIHVCQYKELWYLGFLPVYVWDWIVGLIKHRDFGKAYLSIRMEQEARAGQDKVGYLDTREKFAWTSYLVE